MAQGFNDTQEFKELSQRVSDIRTRQAHERQTPKKNDDAVNKSGDICLTQIRTIRRSFNAIFDCLERRTVSEKKSSKTLLRNKIQADVDQIDDVTDKLEMLSEALKDGSDTNEALSYIGFSKCDEVIFNAQILLDKIAKTTNIK